MGNYKQMLMFGGVLNLGVALFQAIISFSPSLSLYFGAPDALVTNAYALILVGFSVAGILAVFGLYAMSGAGYIRPLPWLKQMLVVISGIFILRGLLLVPELLIMMGVFHISIPVAPRFIVFSLGSLLMGFIFITGTMGGWKSFPSNIKGIAQQ